MSLHVKIPDPRVNSTSYPAPTHPIHPFIHPCIHPSIRPYTHTHTHTHVHTHSLTHSLNNRPCVHTPSRLVHHWLNSSVSSQTTSDCARGLAVSLRHISNKLSSCMHHNQSIPYVHTTTHGRVVSRYC